GGTSHDEHVNRRLQPVAPEQGAQRLAQAPPDAVADDRIANLAANDYGYPHLSGPRLPHAHRDVLAAPRSTPHEPLEVPLGLQRPRVGGRWQRSETVRRWRPLARRRARTRRPAAVAMRARKPCVLARLRRLGW